MYRVRFHLVNVFGFGHQNFMRNRVFAGWMGQSTSRSHFNIDICCHIIWIACLDLTCGSKNLSFIMTLIWWVCVCHAD